MRGSSRRVVGRMFLASLVVGTVAATYIKRPRERLQDPIVREPSQDEVDLQTATIDEQTMQLVVGDALIAPAPDNLETMSETFRNTSFLVAIRDAGFICEDVVDSSHGGGGVWTASCRDMRGYTIDVSESGELVVAPIAHYFDGIPVTTTPYRFDLERPLDLLEQQRRNR